MHAFLAGLLITAGIGDQWIELPRADDVKAEMSRNLRIPTASRSACLARVKALAQKAVDDKENWAEVSYDDDNHLSISVWTTTETLVTMIYDCRGNVLTRKSGIRGFMIAPPPVIQTPLPPPSAKQKS